MKKNQLLEERVEQAISSLDGIQRADPGPWFYARLNNLLKNRRSTWYAVGSFLSRPSIAFGGILGVLVLNLLLLVNEQKSAGKSSAQQGIVTDNEYITASNSSFEFENLVQP